MSYVSARDLAGADAYGFGNPSTKSFETRGLQTSRITDGSDAINKDIWDQFAYLKPAVVARVRTNKDRKLDVGRPDVPISAIKTYFAGMNKATEGGYNVLPPALQTGSMGNQIMARSVGSFFSNIGSSIWKGVQGVGRFLANSGRTIGNIVGVIGGATGNPILAAGAIKAGDTAATIGDMIASIRKGVGEARMSQMMGRNEDSVFPLSDEANSGLAIGSAMSQSQLIDLEVTKGNNKQFQSAFINCKPSPDEMAPWDDPLDDDEYIVEVLPSIPDAEYVWNYDIATAGSTEQSWVGSKNMIEVGGYSIEFFSFKSIERLILTRMMPYMGGIITNATQLKYPSGKLVYSTDTMISWLLHIIKDGDEYTYDVSLGTDFSKDPMYILVTKVGEALGFTDAAESFVGYMLSTTGDTWSDNMIATYFPGYEQTLDENAKRDLFLQLCDPINSFLTWTKSDPPSTTSQWVLKFPAKARAQAFLAGILAQAKTKYKSGDLTFIRYMDDTNQASDDYKDALKTIASNVMVDKNGNQLSNALPPFEGVRYTNVNPIPGNGTPNNLRNNYVQMVKTIWNGNGISKGMNLMSKIKPKPYPVTDKDKEFLAKMKINRTMSCWYRHKAHYHLNPRRNIV